MKAIVLCAGLGTRLRPHTVNHAKPSLPILNIPIFYFNFYYLYKLGVRNFVINTHHAPDSMLQIISNLKSKYSVSFEVSHESPQILGSGGALIGVKDYLKNESDFLFTNGDEVYLLKDGFKNFVNFHNIHKPLATLLVTKNAEVGRKFGGVWSKDDFNVHTFSKTSLEKPYFGWHFTGTICLNNSIYNYIPELGESNILYDVLTKGIKNGEKVLIYPTEMDWMEVGNENDYIINHKYLLDLLYTKKSNINSETLIDILKFFHPNLIETQNGVWTTDSSLDFKNVKLYPPVLLGNNIKIDSLKKIGPYVTLDNDLDLKHISSIQESFIYSDKNIKSNDSIVNKTILN